jgi:hypothetical protein
MKLHLLLVRLRLGALLATAATLVALVSLTLGYLAATTNPAHVYWDTARSTAAIEVPQPGDSTVGNGTAFYVTPHLLLTCSHVTDGARTCRVLRNFSDSSDVLEGRVLYSDTLRDVAIVYTDSVTPSPPLKLDDAEVGMPVFAIGNPYGYLASFSAGVVSQLRDDEANHRGLVQCTSATGHGGSGGPLLNDDGRVVGMTSFGDGDDAYLYTFGVDAETLREVMHSFSGYAGCIAGGCPGLSSADSALWAGVALTPADREMLWWRDQGAIEALLGDSTETILAGAPIAACLLALGAVLMRRHRRLRRDALRRAIRRQLDALKDHAYLPDPLVEFECHRA